MKTAHISEQSGRIPPINPGSTGDGFTMAVDAGGRTVNMDLAMEELRFYRPQGIDRIKSLPSGPQVAKVMKVAVERLPKSVLTWFARSALTSWVAPTAKLFPAGAIVVSSAGRRFANEQDVRRLARALVDEPQNRCYIVFDAAVAHRFSAWPNPISTFPGMAYAYLQDYQKFRPDVIHEGATIGVLAAQIGVPADALTATVEDWNTSAAAGEDATFSRADLGDGVRVGPFYALGPLGAFVTLTDGGVVVDEQCRVLGSDDVPIPGLYAAGSTGQGGLLLRNHGLHIAWAMTSGRIAGRSAALSAP
jgi:fumarate reductase flavoprotein subunit